MPQKPTFTVRANVTEPLVVILQSINPTTGVVTAVDITGFTLAALHMRSTETQIWKKFDTGGAQLSVTDAANGEVTFNPLAGDYLGTDKNYDIYLEVTDGAGDITSFPSGENARLKVLAESDA